MSVIHDVCQSACSSPEKTVPKNLIRVVEVWTPNSAGDRLELSSATYGGLDDFREASQSLSFAKGDAFPGRVWETHAPLVLPDLYTEDFKRADAARSVGLTSGLAIPVVDGEDLCAVVLLLCDQTQGAQGAFEVWQRDERQELGLSGEYYANLERFSSISSHIKFPRGAGLPGGVWDDELPRIIDGLTPESGFTRAAGTGAEGLDIAIGLPIMRSVRTLDSVVLILSARDAPMAREFGVWSTVPGNEDFALRQSARSQGAARQTSGALSQAIVKNVRSSRVPIVASEDSDETSFNDATSWYLGLPFFVGTDLRAVLTITN